MQAGAHILEPSMGVGHFFGMMPRGLYADTKRTGVELDSITARIAAKLYPDSNIHAKALEERSSRETSSMPRSVIFRLAITRI